VEKKRIPDAAHRELWVQLKGPQWFENSHPKAKKTELGGGAQARINLGKLQKKN